MRQAGPKLDAAKIGSKFVQSPLKVLVSVQIRVEASASSGLHTNFEPILAASSWPATELKTSCAVKAC